MTGPRPGAGERLRRHLGEGSAAGSTLWLVAERVLRLGLAVVVGAMVVRHLGPEAFGRFASATAFTAVFLAIANLGVDGLVVRDLARRPDRAGMILGTTAALKGLAGGCCWIASILTAWAMYPDDGQLRWAIAIAGAMLALQSADTFDLWFQSRRANRFAALARLAANIVASAVKIGLVLAGAGMLSFVAVVAVEAAIAAVGLWIAFRRRGDGPPRWTPHRAYARRLLRECWPYALAGVAVIGYMRVDLLMLHAWVGEAEAGFYAAAATISGLWHIVGTALTTSLAPGLANLRQSDPAAYRLRLAQAMRLYAAGGLIAAAATALASPLLVRLLYGEAFAAAAPILAIHACTNIAIFLGLAQGLWVVNERAGGIGLIKTLSGLAASLAGNALLIPLGGGVGAAAAAVAAQAVSAVLSNLLLAPDIFRMQLRALALLPPPRQGPSSPSA